MHKKETEVCSAGDAPGMKETVIMWVLPKKTFLFWWIKVSPEHKAIDPNAHHWFYSLLIFVSHIQNTESMQKL